jgi:flagellar hook-associated protein 3 FlgL
MRINPNIDADMLFGVAQDRQQEDQAIQELSTGQKVNQPSDNPAAESGWIVNQAQESSDNTYLSNISSLQATMQTADSALSSVITALTQAITLGVQGTDSTLSQSNRDAIAQQVGGIQQQILGYANQTFQGNYLFAGKALNTQPFVADSSSPSGYRYVGSTGVNNVDVGNGQSVPTSLPGSQLFTASGSDVFQSLTDLVNALQNNSNISGAETEVQNAFNNVNSQRTFYGATLSRLTTASTFLNAQNLQLTEEDTNLIGADAATATTQLTQAETALDATLAAGGSVSQKTLLDYLT